jgi:hypothetical protein
MVHLRNSFPSSHITHVHSSLAIKALVHVWNLKSVLENINCHWSQVKATSNITAKMFMGSALNNDKWNPIRDGEMSQRGLTIMSDVFRKSVKISDTMSEISYRPIFD